MFFKDYFISVAEVLNLKYKGIYRKNQNPADKGELCELFIKDFLLETFSDNFKIFRGGKIVSSDNSESKQLDIVLCSKKSLTIFGDKGIYPIEKVYGVFSITSTLSKKKLNDCIKEFQSIPKKDPKFFYPAIAEYAKMSDPTMVRWNQLVPFKCVWAYSGKISGKWVLDLNKLVKEEKLDRHLLPDLIVVNKVGTLTKNHHLYEEPFKFLDNAPYYIFHDYKKTLHAGAYLAQILDSLFLATTYQDVILPKYQAYFLKDL